jgi:ParB family chromosome partitioning protein
VASGAARTRAGPVSALHVSIRLPSRVAFDRLTELLAFCAAQTVNAVRLKTERAAESRMQHAALLADALDLDMTEWFTPTADNYFAKISKAQTIDALREIKGSVAPAWSGMKKSELAALAERETAGRRWLPEPLRIAATNAAPDA